MTVLQGIVLFFAGVSTGFFWGRWHEVRESRKIIKAVKDRVDREIEEQRRGRMAKH